VLLHAAGHLAHQPLLLLLAVPVTVLLESLQEALVENARHVLVQLLIRGEKRAKPFESTMTTVNNDEERRRPQRKTRG
jgi:hypothetical protein